MVKTKSITNLTPNSICGSFFNCLTSSLLSLYATLLKNLISWHVLSGMRFLRDFSAGCLSCPALFAFSLKRRAWNLFSASTLSLKTLLGCQSRSNHLALAAPIEKQQTKRFCRISDLASHRSYLEPTEAIVAVYLASGQCACYNHRTFKTTLKAQGKWRATKNRQCWCISDPCWVSENRWRIYWRAL